ncbi:Na+/H+ antiporter subunit A [Streptomyces sp. TP-A0874]|uniref:Na+/H+ antiporter subunit A n=1 Tax=Streptomyces sp. TP-A0874 TaxID=549819 RepID=UPI00099FE4FB|nr:Na+/H+ antiporter subunit A [Streptomyces sp. TP-A0874]
MLVLLLLHFALAVCAGALVERLGRRAFWVLAVPPAATAIAALLRSGPTAAGGATDWNLPWIPEYHVSLAFRLDALSCLMVLIAGGIGALVLLYCAEYFDTDEPNLGRFAGTLIAFAGAMIGLVLADDLILLYVFWELTTVFSFLLIGQHSEKRENRRSALQALLLTVLGGLCMLVGFIVLGEGAGTYRISELAARPPQPSITLSVAAALILLGVMSKSALWPFSFWLPGAMTAPTPVSAYLHAAAMVKAGVYLVLRLAPLFADIQPWRPVLLVFGAATMLLGGWRALRLNDLKLLLAHGTVSQLGFIALLAGVGTRNTALAATALLLAHAVFKSTLFLVVGVIDRTTGTRDLRRLSGLGRARPWLCAVGCAAGASMAGLPPMLGFPAKEAAFGVLAHGGSAERWALGVSVLGSALTTGYTLRFLWGAFARKRSAGRGRFLRGTPVRRTAGGLFLAAPTVLTLSALAMGATAAGLDPLLAAHADLLPSPGAPYHLALWHGIGTALGLSALAWAGGLALFAMNRRLAAFQLRVAWSEAEGAFRAALWTLERLSLRLTGAVQRGSLPFYLGVAFTVLIGTQIAVLAVERPWPAPVLPRPWDSLPQAAVGLGLMVVAVLCVGVRRRMKAVVLSGVVGYGTGVLFVLQGAPDLALTQFAVETVALVVFVLVLRRLPPNFTMGFSTWRRGLHGALAVSGGVLLAGLVWLAASDRRAPPAGPELVRAAWHEGVINTVATTLVDMRAWDTMGESAVLGVAAIGVTSLVFLHRRVVGGETAEPDEAATPTGAGGPPPGTGTDEPEEAAGASVLASPGPHSSGGDAPERRWLAAAGGLAPERRSIVFEVIARLTFHPILVLSLYLLVCAENFTGGGFTAGLVAGLALVVRYLAGGRQELAAAAPVEPGRLIGAGLLLMAGLALAGLVFGSHVLRPGVHHGHLPLIGPFHIASPVVFDTGVFLVVLGVVLDIGRSLGSRIDLLTERQLEHRTSPWRLGPPGTRPGGPEEPR